MSLQANTCINFQKSKEANFSTYLIIVRALPDSLTSLPQDLDIDSLHCLPYIFSYFRCKNLVVNQTTIPQLS